MTVPFVQYPHWRLLLIFSALGPAVGGAGYFLLTVGLWVLDSTVEIPPAPLVLALAYAFGVVPAFLTGLLLPFARRALPQRWRGLLWHDAVFAGLLGAGVALAFFAFVVPSNLVLLPALGALAAFVCQWVDARR